VVGVVIFDCDVPVEGEVTETGEGYIDGKKEEVIHNEEIRT
jgi:hypothetical protein